MISLERILDRQTDRQYKNCISLGWFCGTASALSKLGLRSHSGPFDWYFSKYSAVLDQIENDFIDFMKKENLSQDENNPKAFIDNKYGFHCNHDIQDSFEEEYETIYSKYLRRVDAFREMVKAPTVFFRTVRDNEEIAYINDNWKYAKELLERYNPNNRIIYVMHSGLDAITDNVESYKLNISQYKGNTYDMRHLFDTSEELVSLCCSLVAPSIMEANIDFDNKVNAQKATAAFVNRCIEEDKPGIDAAITEAFGLSKSEGIYIWGAGKFGIPLANYLRKHDVNVLGIIDNKMAGKCIDGFQVTLIDEVPEYAKIFIAVSNKRFNTEILQQISDADKSLTAIRYEELYEEDMNI